MISSLLDLDSAGIFDGFRPLRVDEEVTHKEVSAHSPLTPSERTRVRDPDPGSG
jgi:hypothetical protein